MTNANKMSSKTVAKQIILKLKNLAKKLSNTGKNFNITASKSTNTLPFIVDIIYFGGIK